jgi:phenylacetate-CoA ligase
MAMRSRSISKPAPCAISPRAAECDARGGLHVQEDHFFPEVVDPVTGALLPSGVPGELVLTTLTREAVPVLRCRTGDVTSLDPEPCPCGRTLVRMARVGGRIDDMLIVRGVNVFPSDIESVLLRIPDLAPHYQIVVDRPRALDVLEVQVERRQHRRGGERGRARAARRERAAGRPRTVRGGRRAAARRDPTQRG